MLISTSLIYVPFSDVLLQHSLSFLLSSVFVSLQSSPANSIILWFLQILHLGEFILRLALLVLCCTESQLTGNITSLALYPDLCWLVQWFVSLRVKSALTGYEFLLLVSTQEGFLFSVWVILRNAEDETFLFCQLGGVCMRTESCSWRFLLR